MKAKNMVSALAAAILAVSMGMSGQALAGDRHHGGYKHGYSGGHGYKHYRGHGGYKRGHGHKRHYRHPRHHGYRGHGHRHHYGYRGYPRSYYYYDDDNDDLLLGLLLGGFAGYALHPGYRY